MSPIDHVAEFARKVGGVPQARFRLDPEGQPLFEPDEEEPDLRHYKIELSLATPRAAEIDGVTYTLDKETYWDPVAASIDRKNNFAVRVSSYGDFEVSVEVQLGPKAYEERALLSDLLEAGHQGDPSPAIREAIARIKAH
jgi:hypothetical protein